MNLLMRLVMNSLMRLVMNLLICGDELADMR